MMTATAVHGSEFAGRNIAVSATISPTVPHSQTVRFEPKAVVTPLVAALSAAGYPTAGDGKDLQLAAIVTAYDSGSYIGFAKTASIAIDFELVDAGGDTIKAWHADCKHRVGFNMRSTATRNAEAVTACFEQIARDAVSEINTAP